MAIVYYTNAWEHAQVIMKNTDIVRYTEVSKSTLYVSSAYYCIPVRLIVLFLISL